MSRLRDPRPAGLSAEVDSLLASSLRLVQRGASDREATWQRLEARLGGSPVAGRRLAIHWPRLGIAAAAIAVLAGTAVMSAGGRRLGAHLHPLPASAAVTAASSAPGSVGRTGWHEIDLGPNGHLAAEPQAQFSLTPDSTSAIGAYVIRLERGEICVQVFHRDPVSQGPFVVNTSQLRAIAVGTRFCVFAGSDAVASWVMVEEGKVRVEGPSGESRLAEAGMVVSSRELKKPASNPLPTAGTAASSLPTGVQHVPIRSCPLAPRAARDACLWRKAKGTGLGAQNALYLLGVEADGEQQPGQALAIWENYLRRFPDGILGAEASFNAFEDLLEERRFQDALAAADDLLVHHAGFVRAGEVRLHRAELLRTTLDRPQEARAEYQRILFGEARDLLRDDALYGLGLCEEGLDGGAVQATWAAYLSEFPTGRHRAEVLARQHGD